MHGCQLPGPPRDRGSSAPVALALAASFLACTGQPRTIADWAHQHGNIFAFQGGFACDHTYACTSPGAPTRWTLTFQSTRSAPRVCRSPAGAYVDEGGLLRREENEHVVGRLIEDVGQAWPAGAPVWLCRRAP